MKPIGLDVPQQDAFAVRAFRLGCRHTEQRPTARRVIHHRDDHPIVLPAHKRRRVSALVSTEQQWQFPVERDGLQRAVKRPFRLVRPRVAQAAEQRPIRLHPIVNHVVAAIRIDDADVRRRAAVIK